MYSNVEVKCGKPLLLISHRNLRTIGLATCIIHVVIIIYVLELFYISIDIKQKLGNYIDLILEHGNVLPMITSISALLSGILNTLTIICVQKSFSSNNKIMSTFLFLDVILTLCFSCIFFGMMFVTISYGYKQEPKYIKYLLEAMQNYSNDGLIKSKLDTLQVELQCCGSRNYTDWYYIDWYDKNFVKTAEVSVIGHTPFSCCSIRSHFPCIHHGIEYGAGAYHYENDANFSLSQMGCFHVIEKQKKQTSLNVIGYLICLFLLNGCAVVPLRILQTAHIERGKFDKENHMYTSWLIGCYIRQKKLFNNSPLVPPTPPNFSTS